MLRTALGSVVGMLLGVGCTALILFATNQVVAWMTAPVRFEIEYGVIYLTVILGAGFGSVCGAMVGLASAVLREWRRSRDQTTASPAGPVPGGQQGSESS